MRRCFWNRRFCYCKPWVLHRIPTEPRHHGIDTIWHVNHFVDSQLISFCLFFVTSVFGEDALVNVSVEKKDDNDGKLAGYIRIRSKTQGIALSLGDRITSVQRGLPDQPKQ